MFLWPGEHLRLNRHDWFLKIYGPVNKTSAEQCSPSCALFTKPDDKRGEESASDMVPSLKLAGERGRLKKGETRRSVCLQWMAGGYVQNVYFPCGRTFCFFLKQSNKLYMKYSHSWNRQLFLCAYHLATDHWTVGYRDERRLDGGTKA